MELSGEEEEEAEEVGAVLEVVLGGEEEEVVVVVVVDGLEDLDGVEIEDPVGFFAIARFEVDKIKYGTSRARVGDVRYQKWLNGYLSMQLKLLIRFHKFDARCCQDFDPWSWSWSL